MYALNFALAALATIASVVHASPTLSARQSDNGYCQQLLKICEAAPNTLADPWSSKACIFGATCFGNQPSNVDDFLAALAGSKHAPALKSVNAPRVSQSVFDSISTNGQVITQPNYIEAVFGTLATTNGPFPAVSVFIDLDYQRLTTWTASCNGQGVPFKNFADYYQFSSTVSSPGCPSSTNPSSLSKAPTPVISEVSCNKMFTTCVSQSNSAVSDAWSHLACVYAASCFPGAKPVDSLLAAVFAAKGGSGSPPISTTEIRLSTATMKIISTDGTGISQQNFVDGYYSTLSSVGGPFPTSSAVVVGYFNIIRSSTSLSSAEIPFINFANYFQFPSSAIGSVC